jgi:hypothetical protein
MPPECGLDAGGRWAWAKGCGVLHQLIGAILFDFRAFLRMLELRRGWRELS